MKCNQINGMTAWEFDVSTGIDIKNSRVTQETRSNSKRDTAARDCFHQGFTVETWCILRRLKALQL